MSIPILAQVYDETRRLAIAGSAVAVGDFRLKKLVPALQQAGVKAPVFAKLATSAAKVVESSEATAAESVLELSVLVNAILYTQGETGIEGKLEAIETTPFELRSANTGARALKPLLEALTTTGGGRVEVIRDAFDRGLFNDFRLIGPSIKAIDDSYPEIAEFVADKILPLYGKAILPEIVASYDPKGKAGHVRRLKLMHRLDPIGARDKVKHALDEGSKEVKVAAIECLGGEKEDLEFLLEQVKAKAVDVRKAAYKGLSKIDDDRARGALKSGLGGEEIEAVWIALLENRDPRMGQIIQDELEALLANLLKSKEKDKAVLGKEVKRLGVQLECLAYRKDPATDRFLLKLFQQREKIAAIKGEPGGKDIVDRLMSMISRTRLLAGKALIDERDTLAAAHLPYALHVACRLLSPAEVFDSFSPYLAELRPREKIEKKRAMTHAALMRMLTGTAKKSKVDVSPADAIVECLIYGRDGQPNWASGFDIQNAMQDEEHSQLIKTLDPRWLDLAVDGRHFDLVQKLARHDHPGAMQILGEGWEEFLASNQNPWEGHWQLKVLFDMKHSAAPEGLITLIRRSLDGGGYGLFWIHQIESSLPASIAASLESLIPEIPEKHADELLKVIAQLKRRTAS